jgi:hypothetical protein
MKTLARSFTLVNQQQSYTTQNTQSQFLLSSSNFSLQLRILLEEMEIKREKMGIDEHA